ncbi:MAG: hypothetical protein IT432_12115 [Phycisphaerales bacterium]|nr:hypothetical protein [Phycisphaerales bacterium]
MLSLLQQLRLLRARYPGIRVWTQFVCGTQCLYYTLRTRPTSFSASYTLLGVYSVGGPPVVWVLDPVLEHRVIGEPIPHVNPDGTLCLYDPDGNEWNGTMSLASTTIPWALRWLFHYEHWRVFGEWLGDGPAHAHTPPDTQSGITREEAA